MPISLSDSCEQPRSTLTVTVVGSYNGKGALQQGQDFSLNGEMYFSRLWYRLGSCWTWQQLRNRIRTMSYHQSLGLRQYR